MLDGVLAVDEDYGSDSASFDLERGNHVLRLEYINVGEINPYYPSDDRVGSSDDVVRFSRTEGNELVSNIRAEADFCMSAEGVRYLTRNPAVHPWALEDGSMVSGNAGIDLSESRMGLELSAGAGFELSFDWSVSSEAGWDELVVTVDGAEVMRVSGEHSGHFSKRLLAGERQVSIAYVKDKRTSAGADRAVISNVSAVADFTGDVNANGVVNVVDSRLAYDISRGKFSASHCVDMRARADVAGDGAVDAVDAFATQCAILNGWLEA